MARRRGFMAVAEKTAESKMLAEVRQRIADEQRVLKEASQRTAYDLMDVGQVEALVKAQDEAVYRRNLKKRAKAIMAARLGDYAQLHYRATMVAAEKGDARPAEWALQSIKVDGEAAVEPPAKEAPQSGVKILIGVNLGGLGVTEAVSPSNEEKANEGFPPARHRVLDARVVEGTPVGGSDPDPLS